MRVLLAQTWWDRLLGLRELSAGDAEAALGLARDLPGWAWLLLAMASMAYAGWAYHRLAGPRWVRGGLAGLRWVTVLVIVLLLCGPELVRSEERVEPDVLAMLVDRSASMRVADMRDAAGDAVSRDAALRTALNTQWPGVSSALPADRRVVWLGFGGSVFGLGERRVDPGESSVRDAVALDLGEPTQDGTKLRTAVEAALARLSGRPVAGLVVFSDGQSPQEISGALASKLSQAGVTVFVVPLGSANPGADYAVVQVDAPRRAFADDRVPVSVLVERLGDQGGDAAAEPVTLRLIDTSTGEVLDEREVPAERFGRPVRMQARAQRVGEVTWAVEAVAGMDADELNLANNRGAVAFEVIDRPVRVLYLEGYPRWEYRYLKNLLVREPSIDSSVLLISADATFAQEGDTPITRPPMDAEEMSRYDVVILGDLPAGFLSEEQLKLLRDHVAQRGAGLLWIGGPYATPVSWGGSVLADLLPMREPSAVTPWPGTPAAIQPTPLAEALSVLQLGEADDPSAWPATLPWLEWVQRTGPLKPAAEVLAVARTAGAAREQGDTPGAAPAVVRMRFGAGQAVYLATDETWRWRRGRGERYPEQFYVQLVRMLGRGAVAVGDDRARLNVSSRRVTQAGTVVVELIVEEPSLLTGEPTRLAAQIIRLPEEGDRPGDLTAGIAGGDVVGDLTLTRQDPESGGDAARRTYTATWTADQPGRYALRLTEASLQPLGLEATVQVVAPDDELRRPAADHGKLAALAEATGGGVIALDALARLNEPGLVRSVARRTAADRAEPVWHSPLALGVLLVLLGVEWSVRRVIRLA